MGMYNAVAFDFQIKPDVPDNLREVLVAMFLNVESDVTLTSPTYDMIDKLVDGNLSVLTRCGSAYHDGYAGRMMVKLDNGDVSCHSRASAKAHRVQLDQILNVLNLFLPYMRLVDGQIIFRTIYEEAMQEEVIYYHEGLNNLQVEEGYKYRGEWTGADSDHPNNSEPGQELFEPPNSIYAIREYLRNFENPKYANLTSKPENFSESVLPASGFVAIPRKWGEAPAESPKKETPLLPGPDAAEVEKEPDQEKIECFKEFSPELKELIKTLPIFSVQAGTYGDIGNMADAPLFVPEMSAEYYLTLLRANNRPSPTVTIPYSFYDTEASFDPKRLEDFLGIDTNEDTTGETPPEEPTSEV